MKKTIGMVLALCMMGCTAQPAQLPNHHEKQEKTKDILQFLPKEEKRKRAGRYQCWIKHFYAGQ